MNVFYITLKMKQEATKNICQLEYWNYLDDLN